MVHLAGIVLSLALMIWLAYRGWSILLLAPLCALLAAGAAGEPILAHWSQTFMSNAARFVAQFFPIFLLGALFGKLMQESGAVNTLAGALMQRLGPRHAILGVVLAGAILTYGGVSLFVAFFVLAPMGHALFKAANIPHRLMPAAIALGTSTFTMTAMPGTPAIQNAIPMPFFDTNPYAAPGLGLIASAIMALWGLAWLRFSLSRARSRGEGYSFEEAQLREALPHAPETTPSLEQAQAQEQTQSYVLTNALTKARTRAEGLHQGQEQGQRAWQGEGQRDQESQRAQEAQRAQETQRAPARKSESSAVERAHGAQRGAAASLWLALLPLAAVIGMNLLMTFVILPRMDASYLSSAQWGQTSLEALKGVWSVIVALALGIVVALATAFKRLPQLRQTMDAGVNSAVLPMLNVASLVGFGAVIAALPGFEIVKQWVLHIGGGPLVSLAAAANILAALTGSASGGLTIALDALAANYMGLSSAHHIDPALMHRVAVIGAGTLDSLPHNGAVVSLLGVCGAKHRGSYGDIVMAAIAGPLLALVAVIALGSFFGSF